MSARLAFPNEQKALECVHPERPSSICICRICVSNGTPVSTTVPVSLTRSKNAAIRDVNRGCARGSLSGGQSCHPDGGGGIHPNRVSSRKEASAVFPREQRPF